MKHIATLALMLNLGVAGVDAQEKPVKMTFSGTAGDSAINLQIPDTTTSEYNFAGKGTLGSFTFRTVSASGASSSPPPGTCSGANQIYGTAKAGAGVFRFRDGSLLKVNLTEGADCIDLAHPGGPQAHCTRTFQIIGGTYRFKNASGGYLMFDETLVPVLADFLNNPVLFAVTGYLTGTVSGVDAEQERHDPSEKTK